VDTGFAWKNALAAEINAHAALCWGLEYGDHVDKGLLSMLSCVIFKAVLILAFLKYEKDRICPEKKSSLERFPKSVARFSDKKRDKNKELERSTEPREVKAALECGQHV